MWDTKCPHGGTLYPTSGARRVGRPGGARTRSDESVLSLWHKMGGVNRACAALLAAERRSYAQRDLIKGGAR